VMNARKITSQDASDSHFKPSYIVNQQLTK